MTVVLEFPRHAPEELSVCIHLTRREVENCLHTLGAWWGMGSGLLSHEAALRHALDLARRLC